MGYDTPDVYNQPEKFNLEPVAEIDYSDKNYCFDTRVVWKHKETGKLYTARDSGCSCPSPFEGYTSLEKCSPFNLEEIENEIKKERSETTEWSHYEGDDPTVFLQKIRSL